MIFDFKKSFDLIYKKNKTLAVIIIAIMCIALFQIISVAGFNHMAMVKSIHNKVLALEPKVEEIEKQMITYDTISRDFIKRSSFNAYINRKDHEYHEQMDMNNALSSKTGFLEGQVSAFSEMLDMFNIPERINEIDYE